MSSFMESICKIGIFMIAAQAVIHFAPAAKYEKYMRLVVGIIVLLQFLVPINKITDGIDGSREEGVDWSGQLAKMEKELERGLAVEGGDGGSQFNENFISGMEMEIKSKLNSALDDENYSVLKVNVVMDSAGGGNGQYYMQYNNENNSGYEKYQLNAIQVYVMVHDDKNSSIIKVEKVHINKIGADEDDVNMNDTGQTTSNEKLEDNNQKDNKQKESARLREKFAAVLEVEEKYMEVSIYGWTE